MTGRMGEDMKEEGEYHVPEVQGYIHTSTARKKENGWLAQNHERYICFLTYLATLRKAKVDHLAKRAETGNRNQHAFHRKQLSALITMEDAHTFELTAPFP